MNRYLLIALVALVTLGSCQVPLGQPGTGVGKFTLVSSQPPQLKPVAGNGRTILPTAPVANYTLVLSVAGTPVVTIPSLTNLNQSFEAPAGTYDLVVTMYDGALEIGKSAGQPIVVVDSPAAADNKYIVTVLPETGGTGELSVSYSWPSSLVTDAVFSLVNTADITKAIVLSPAIDYMAGTASLDMTLPSGSYYLVLTLAKNWGGVAVPHPAVSEIVQIYNNLESSKTYTLTNAYLNGAPAAPASLSAAYDAVNGSYHLDWTMPAGTQSGFHIYRDGVLVKTVTDRAALSDEVSIAPAQSAEVFEIAAFNAFGESTTIADPVSFTPFVVKDYQLKIGTSETLNATETLMHLTWTNPSNDIVYLYRAERLTGPYEFAFSSAGESFDDSTAVSDIQLGTTYYYAFSNSGSSGYVFPGASHTYNPSGAPSFVHPDPVAGVVSGTTLDWDSTLQKATPVVAMPYIDATSATAQLPNPTNVSASWLVPERPDRALLYGGYTYWVWGTTSAGDNETIVAAFDSDGTFEQHLQVSPNSFITDVKALNHELVITGLNGVTAVDLDDLNWFGTPSLSVTINFSVPTAPTVVFAGGTATLDGTLDGTPETMVIDSGVTTLSSGEFSVLEWTVDGITGSAALTDISEGIVLINSQYLTKGTHEIMVTITDDVHVYSANFYITVIKTVSAQ